MKLVEEGFCPTYRLTRTAFERPFTSFVKDVFDKQPGLPCFKVSTSARLRASRQICCENSNNFSSSNSSSYGRLRFRPPPGLGLTPS